MSYNVKPGDKAVIIGSINGPKGLSVGRNVRVLADSPVRSPDWDAKWSDANNARNDPQHYCPPSPYEKEHTKWGKIWPVVCLNGGTFADDNGGVHQYIDVPDQFLRKLVDPQQAPEVKKADLELTQ